jgi:hypothetical protein
MTLTKNVKRTSTARTSAPHRIKPTRRSVHRRTGTATRSVTHDALITVDSALLTEARDWTIFAGVSLLGWLVGAIAFGVV